ncbi:hypothetical protein FHT02_000369 [Sphingomonas xinjiangensis]|uniref:Uncharacterized protein n=1 Tax=Sphingomonas xinjiangensis TaxID=643568 RepID=A0A840YP84_9SPHN|nr:hypothetical protein [Sphingomonas xinjiangensis]
MCVPMEAASATPMVRDRALQFQVALCVLHIEN